MAEMASLAKHLGDNMRQLREARGLTQAQIAKLAELPRATWANVESGASNPTLSVLSRIAAALQVSLEELVARPRASARHVPRAQLSVRMRGTVTVRRLLPEPIPGVEMERMEFPRGAKLTGVPHTPGTREYLTCERGLLDLWASGENYRLEPGDVVVFRGDQRHAYANVGEGLAIGYSVVILNPPQSWFGEGRAQ
jgi:XRE family transcriptional regulator, regulator of sulfur utilization